MSLRRDDDAVSEMVASVLLVGITVLLAVVAGALILSRPGPVDTTRPHLLFAVNPGNDGSWSTGNENVSIYHAGGEALRPSSTLIRVTGGTPQREYRESTLGGPFAETAGFRIGTTWYSTSQAMTIASGASIRIDVVAFGETGSRLAGNAELAAGI